MCGGARSINLNQPKRGDAGAEMTFAARLNVLRRVGVIRVSSAFVSADEDDEDGEAEACGRRPPQRPEVVSVERVSGGFLQATVETRV